MRIYTEKDIRRFYTHVSVSKKNECWEWLGSTSKGYGRFGFNGKMMQANRFAFWIATGHYPGDLCVCHSCDNPACVNPAHLFLGTMKDNMEDAVKKGRTAVGVMNGKAKLTEDEVQEIRARYEAAGFTQKQLARRYGVTQQCIHFILRHESWRHI